MLLTDLDHDSLATIFSHLTTHTDIQNFAFVLKDKELIKNNKESHKIETIIPKEEFIFETDYKSTINNNNILIECFDEDFIHLFNNKFTNSRRYKKINELVNTTFIDKNSTNKNSRKYNIFESEYITIKDNKFNVIFYDKVFPVKYKRGILDIQGIKLTDEEMKNETLFIKNDGIYFKNTRLSSYSPKIDKKVIYFYETDGNSVDDRSYTFLLVFYNNKVDKFIIITEDNKEYESYNNCVEFTNDSQAVYKSSPTKKKIIKKTFTFPSFIRKFDGELGLITLENDDEYTIYFDRKELIFIKCEYKVKIEEKDIDDEEKDIDDEEKDIDDENEDNNIEIIKDNHFRLFYHKNKIVRFMTPKNNKFVYIFLDIKKEALFKHIYNIIDRIFDKNKDIKKFINLFDFLIVNIDKNKYDSNITFTGHGIKNLLSLFEYCLK